MHSENIILWESITYWKSIIHRKSYIHWRIKQLKRCHTLQYYIRKLLYIVKVFIRKKSLSTENIKYWRKKALYSEESNTEKNYAQKNHFTL